MGLKFLTKIAMASLLNPRCASFLEGDGLQNARANYFLTLHANQKAHMK